MKIIEKNFSETGYFSSLLIDYLSENENLKPFYKYRPDINSFGLCIEEKRTENINRQILVEVLNRQYARLLENNHVCSAALNNIDLLLNQDTFTVTTGHQLCLFTGPLYFIYKIISTIRLAKELKKNYPSCNFVPIYWMAGEDHDFEEINHINLFGKKVEWRTGADYEGKLASGLLQTETLKSVIAEIEILLGNSENSKELIEIFHEAYLNHSNLAEATRSLANSLFGKYGLLVIDANESDLKREFLEIMQEELVKNENNKLVLQTIDKLITVPALTKAKVQVHPREINLFYLENGTRNRIERKVSTTSSDVIYSVLNSTLTFSEQEIISELRMYPERFSPNVILRPLYQEKILPNIAFIGGGAEIAYWLEYKSMFDYHKINFPVLILRNSFLWIDASASEKIAKLNIDPEILFKPTDDIIKLYLNKIGGDDFDLSNEEKIIESVYKSISEKTGKVDGTLKSTVEAELQKNLNSLKVLRTKLVKASKLKEEISLNQIRKIKDKLFPGNYLQERYDNFIPYYLKYGSGFFEILMKESNPLDKKFRILIDK